jgi:hypothetical protein
MTPWTREARWRWGCDGGLARADRSRGQGCRTRLGPGAEGRLAAGSAGGERGPEADPGDAQLLLVQSVPVAELLSQKSGRVGRGARPWFSSK